MADDIWQNDNAVHMPRIHRLSEMKSQNVCCLLFLFILLLRCNNSASNSRDDKLTIKVATFNIWNIMFNWDVRKFRIAQMIQEVSPDIVAFQELRVDKSPDGNDQLEELGRLLPQYKWKHFEAANEVQPVSEAFPGWELEGVGLLSRLPIVHHEVQNLTNPGGPDINQRIVLHAQVLLGSSFDHRHSNHINVAVTHFSYDRQQQCRNVQDLASFFSARRMSRVIVLGDFNAYADFDGPLDALARGDSMATPYPKHKCENFKARPGSLHLVDAWEVTNPNDTGLTFSNMPVPGMESRPDRILVSRDDMRVTSAGLSSRDSALYRAKYYYHVLWNRVESLVGAAYASYRGRRGRSCAHDCGPHASCRCGICVSGGDKNACVLPTCAECGAGEFAALGVAVVLGTLLTAQLIFGALQVLLTMNERSAARQSLLPVSRGPGPCSSSLWGRATPPGGPPPRQAFCCSDCCLCEPQMYSDMAVKFRRSKRMWLCRVYPVLRLPPMVLVAVTAMGLFIYTEVALFLFKDALHNVYAIIPEEWHISDHLMVSATVDVTVAPDGHQVT